MNKIEKLCNLDEFLHTLEVNNYLINPTARSLGVGASTVIRYCDKYNIHLPTKGLKGFNSRYTGVDNVKAKNTYRKMIDRCYNTENKNYNRYGGRGIKVCDNWKSSVLNFYNDLKDLPNAFAEGYSLDRIDNDGNYELGNVRFATSKEQGNNTSLNVVFYVGGVRYTQSQLAEKLGVTSEFIKDRVRLGFTIEQILSIPKGEKRFKPVVNIIKRGHNKLFIRLKPNRSENIEKLYKYDDTTFEEIFFKALNDLKVLCNQHNIPFDEYFDEVACKNKFTQ